MINLINFKKNIARLIHKKGQGIQNHVEWGHVGHYRRLRATHYCASYTLTLAVQHGLGLEVDLRRVRFGRTRAQGVGRERERIGGHLAGLSEGLCAAKHLLSLRLCDRLGARMGQLLGYGVGRLLRWGLGYGLGHGSCALQHRHKSFDVVIQRNWVDDYQTQKTTKKLFRTL